MGTRLSLILTVSVAAVASAGAEPMAGVSHRTRLYDSAIHGRDVFVVGHPGVVLRSTDQGQHFARITVPTADALFSIDINQAGLGAIVGRAGLVLLTSDGGLTWKKTNALAGTEAGEEKPHLFAVDVLESGAIVAAGDFGTILHSSDQGKSWQRRRFDATDPGSRRAASSRDGIPSTVDHDNAGAEEQARLTGVSFGDNQHGFIAGEFGIILASQDGGITWKRQTTSTSKLLFSVYAVGSRHVVAAGSDGTVLETQDGGLAWRGVKSPTSRHLFGIWASAELCVVTGANGMVLVRASGSKELKVVKTDVYTWLASVAFVDSKRGVVAGGRGHLLSTRDGGHTFSLMMGE